MSKWFEIEILTEKAGFDAVTGSLLRLDINGFSINDREEFKAFTEDKDASWDYIDDKLLEDKMSQNSVTCYLADNEQGRAQLELVKNEMKALKERDTENAFGSLEITVREVAEEDWANNWKQYFKPFAVGKNLYVKPSWEEPADVGERRIIEIDPGSSFGTGQHETTRMCLEMLDDKVRPGFKVLDLGCGSGILSIAAARLGAQRIVSVDIDLNSVKIANENFEQNGIDKSIYTTYAGNVLEDKQLLEKIGTGYDVVCANIVSDVLIAMSGLFDSLISDNGVVIISGIIEERMYEVFDKMVENGFKLCSHLKDSGWAAGMFISKARNSQIKMFEEARKMLEEEERMLKAEQTEE
ncbi:MAG: 50S ribosomal protein L11 methyltransferase [Ruminococcus sp.]|nr:50S ribosomal protein L11 methyltransferase [Ruminococcus sp.]MBR2305110.1 50S ribosomal protein L11 methyltransferase [Ruminococcus sp.]